MMTKAVCASGFSPEGRLNDIHFLWLSQCRGSRDTRDAYNPLAADALVYPTANCPGWEGGIRNDLWTSRPAAQTSCAPSVPDPVTAHTLFIYIHHCPGWGGCIRNNLWLLRPAA